MSTRRREVSASAQLLVGECILFARNAGYRQLSLWTNDILDTARSIYVQAGFRLCLGRKSTACSGRN